MNKDFEARHNEVLQILSLLSKEAKRLEEDLVFLGGSAVQAILKNPKRLSIDLDAYYSGDARELITVLVRAGYSNKTRKSINPRMFEYHTARKNDVMVKLDFQKIGVPKEYAFNKELGGSETGKFEVSVGKPEYLMASKLSALAVGTIGRKKESKIDIVKDLFDINSICDEFPSLSAKTSKALEEIVVQQIQLRKTEYTMEEVFVSLERTLKAIARFGEGSFVSQGSLKSFSEYLYEGVLGRTKLQDFRLNASGELTRSELSMMAMRTLYHACVIQHKESTDKGEEAAKKEADRAYVSECEKVLLEMGEDPKMLHELKIFSPRALIFLYCSMLVRSKQP